MSLLDRRILVVTIAALGAAAPGLAGCGQKGPLRLPGQAVGAPWPAPKTAPQPTPPSVTPPPPPAVPGATDPHPIE